MSKKASSVNKRDVYRNCLEYVRRYLVDLAVVQEEVFANLKEEFKPEHVCEPTASPKYLVAITKLASAHNKVKIYSSIKYYKALLCLRHSIHLEPKSLYPRILALRWSVYLGEWEMAEMALAFEKAKPPQKNGVDDHLVEQLVFMTEIVRAYVDFNRDQRSRAVSAKTILTMTEKTNAEERPTFPIFETQAFANWVAAHLPKVAGFRVENLEACTSFAESCELRRDYAIELLSVGMIRDAAAVSQLGLWCAVKSGVLFRILQFVNINTLVRACVVQQEFKKDLRTCLDIMRTIYSSENLSSKTSLGFTKKKPPEMLEFVDNIDLPVSTKTPPRCKSPGRITSKFIDSFHELTLSETICSLHEISEDCECNTCELCSSNYNAAFEYWMSSFLYESMSNDSIQCLEKQFQMLRARVAVEQRAVLGKRVKPRPPSIMCETFAMCAVRWLRSLEDAGWDHDNSALRALREQIVASTLKICGYSSVRTIYYRLAVSQLERIRRVLRPSSHDWMTDPSLTNRVISTVAQYLFSPICRTASSSDSEDSEEQKKAEEAAIAEANAEYASYNNLLCRSMGSSHDVVGVNIVDDASAFSSALAMSHDGSLHLVKMHKDREPIVMPLAPKTKVESVKSMMDKIIEDNTRTSSLGKVTKDAKAFWAARRSVDGDLKNLIPRVQDILLGAAAPLVLPSLCLNRKGLMMAKCLVSASQSPDGSTLSLSYAKELVSLATKLERAEWSRVVERMCDFVGLSSRKEAVQELYSNIRVAVASGGVTTDSGPCYTFLIVCPDLTTFPWEVIPVFRNSPYVARIPAVHTLFQTLRMRKKVPVAVNASNAFYILDPDNNLGDTQRRITDYVSKFGWNGVVGKIPDPDVVKEALRVRDVFFYMGHGSGSRYFSRRVISENVINAVSVLMGCGSVKLTPYGWGMDGKSSVYDYTVAQCPSVVGCLWTVTDGEIDRYFMALVDLCFSSDGNRTLTGTDGGDSRLRVLVEAMHRARSRCKLPYLTGASVVSYGIPVIALE
ncbi:peptidase family C50 [Ancylostoma ceylanicum]|uniref:separase n=1 Tax=Ancylostoma ceylanicum TaxID=53326 RepID=A0A0D6LAT3_9BILA|nr:peptidase family C50 [Ancylostoma ceylanicum]